MIKTDAKSILADSIEDLLKRKSFVNIGVQDIVKNCDVSRTAFYNHFKDKYDLVSWIYRRDVNELPEDVALAVYMWNLASTRLTFTWLREKDERKPEEITSLVCNCLPEPIKAFYI